MRVLVADDDDLACSTLARVLGRAGHDVRTASSAAAAVAIASTWLPEAAILDRHLGDGDGIEVAARLRQTAVERLRIVLLSGDVLDVPNEHVDAVLLKPVGPRAVLDALHDA